jgi:hypothetical protein
LQFEIDWVEPGLMGDAIGFAAKKPEELHQLNAGYSSK